MLQGPGQQRRASRRLGDTVTMGSLTGQRHRDSCHSRIKRSLFSDASEYHRIPGRGPGLQGCDLWGDLRAGRCLNSPEPNRRRFGTPRKEPFLASYDCPTSESALSLLEDSLLAWQRNPAIMLGVSRSTSLGHEHEGFRPAETGKSAVCTDYPRSRKDGVCTFSRHASGDELLRAEGRVDSAP